MVDPHVVALHYMAEPQPGIRYENPPPRHVLTSVFEGELRDGYFVAKMLQHYPTEAEARIPVDAYLRAWEIAAGVARGRTELRFTFDRSKIVDRAPPEPGIMRASSHIVLSRVSVSGTAIVVPISNSYPSPPSGFGVSPLVETMWRRFERHIAGAEPLFAMAYFCLTAIVSDAGGRKQAAAKYKIQPQVLGKLGELSTARGSADDARKVTDQLQPATGKEVAWLLAAVRAVIKQAGAVAAAAQPSMLTMDDLPKV